MLPYGYVNTSKEVIISSLASSVGQYGVLKMKVFSTTTAGHRGTFTIRSWHCWFQRRRLKWNLIACRRLSWLDGFHHYPNSSRLIQMTVLGNLGPSRFGVWFGIAWDTGYQVSMAVAVLPITQQLSFMLSIKFISEGIAIYHPHATDVAAIRSPACLSCWSLS